MADAVGLPVALAAISQCASTSLVGGGGQWSGGMTVMATYGGRLQTVAGAMGGGVVVVCRYLEDRCVQ